ncbi:unnamed protein product [Gadus morhua 'NCC']
MTTNELLVQPKLDYVPRMSTPHPKLHPGTMGILIALETASPVRDAGITPWCLRLRWRGTDRGSRVGLWMTRGSSLPTCDYLLLQISVPHPEGHPGIGPFCPHLTGRLLPPTPRTEEERRGLFLRSFTLENRSTLHPKRVDILNQAGPSVDEDPQRIHTPRVETPENVIISIHHSTSPPLFSLISNG